MHSVIYQMCGVEETGNKTTRVNELCKVAPLDNGSTFEIVEGREIWHLVWKGKINDGVNAEFLKAATDRIWENEQVSIHCPQILKRKHIHFPFRGSGVLKTGWLNLATLNSRHQ